MSRAAAVQDAAFGAATAAGGLLLAWTGWHLPAGVAGVPGPGVFPFAIGLTLAVLGISLTATALAQRREPGENRRPAPAHAGDRGSIRQVVTILVLLALYTLSWDWAPFLWRTPLLLLGVYLTLGEPVLRSAGIAVGATAVLLLIFETMLRVRL